MVGNLLKNFIDQMGFLSKDSNGNINWISMILRLIMIIVAIVLFILAIKKHFEPYLLIPIGMGMLLVNLAPGLMKPAIGTEAPGLFPI